VRMSQLMGHLRRYVGEADAAVPECEAGISPSTGEAGDRGGVCSDGDTQQGVSSEDDHGNGAKRQRLLPARQELLESRLDESAPPATPGGVVRRGRLTGGAWASFLEQQRSAMTVAL
jgi:hypothetical protein